MSLQERMRLNSLYVQEKKAIRSLIGDNVIVLDSEFQGRRIFELGMLRLFEGHVVDQESLLIDPGPEVRVAGITTSRNRIKDQMLRGVGSFSDHSVRVARFLYGASHLIGWNPTQDSPNLHDEFVRAELPHAPMIWIDVARLYECVHNERAPKLEVACERYGIGDFAWHEALEDARATGQLLGALCLDLIGLGATRDDVPLCGGWNGRGWPDQVLQVSPGSLPKVCRRTYRGRPQVGTPAAWRYEQWRYEVGLRALAPKPLPVRKSVRRTA